MTETPTRRLAAPGAEVEASTWVPLRTVAVGPWRAGLSGGFTRRANSALLAAGADPREAVAALDELEALYRDARQPCIVRVPTASSPAPLDARLGAELDVRGYRTGVVTRVLAREAVVAGTPGVAEPASEALAGALVAASVASATPRSMTVTSAVVPDDAWLAGWLGTKSTVSGPVDGETARRLLTGSPASYLTARGGDPDGAVLGTIRVAHAGRWAGLSCLAVAPTARRRGLGRALTQAALVRARAEGARDVFLQVEVGNAPAAALYAALDAVDVDEYAYLHAP